MQFRVYPANPHFHIVESISIGGFSEADGRFTSIREIANEIDVSPQFIFQAITNFDLRIRLRLTPPEKYFYINDIELEELIMHGVELRIDSKKAMRIYRKNKRLMTKDFLLLAETEVPRLQREFDGSRSFKVSLEYLSIDISEKDRIVSEVSRLQTRLTARSNDQIAGNVEKVIKDYFLSRIAMCPATWRIKSSGRLNRSEIYKSIQRDWPKIIKRAEKDLRPNFMTKEHFISVYGLKLDDWALATGSSLKN